MTSILQSDQHSLPGDGAESDERCQPGADPDLAPGRTGERVARLRIAIVQNRDFAKSCDFNFRMQLLALANEMEKYARTLMSPPTEGEWE